MIRISKLMLRNFKSFRKADIPFHEGFTAIAGSNASGKSNILDAILFAFGITSLKMLRASKLTDLINHDAADGFAKAEIELNDGKRTYAISRKIDRQGRSAFRVDGKKRSLNEVATMLLELGIRATGQNFVAQGDITRVIEMNPKQRREVIDEIAGVAEFEEKKAEALKKLEAVDQRVKDATIVLNERENYLAELEKEREAVLRYNSLRGELARSKATLLSSEIARIRKELEADSKKISLAENELGRDESEKKSMDAECARLEKERDSLIKKIIGANEMIYRSIGREVDGMHSEIRVWRERLSAKEQEFARNAERILALKRRHGELSAEEGGKKLALKKTASELPELEKQLKELNSRIGEKSGRAREKGSLISRHEEKLEELRGIINSRKEELYSLSAEMEKKRHAIEVAGGNERELKAELAELDAGIRGKAGERERLGEISAKNPERLLEKNSAELEKAIDRTCGLRNRIGVLEEELQKLRKAKTSCPVCEAALDEKMKARLAAKKSAMVGQMEKELASASAERERLLQGRKRIEKELGEMRSLEAVLKELPKMEARAKEIRGRLAALAMEKMKSELKGLQGREESAKSRLGEIEKEAAQLSEKITSARKGSGAAELDELLGHLRELNRRHAEAQSMIARIDAELKAAGEKKTATELELSETGSGNSSLKAEAEALKLKLAEQEKVLKEKDAELAKAHRETKLYEEEKERLTTKIENTAARRTGLEEKAEGLRRGVNELNIAKSKNEVRIVDMEQEFEQYKGTEIIRNADLRELKARVPRIEREIQELGAINMKATENFGGYKREVEEIREKAAKLEQERVAVLEMIDKIDVKKNQVFMECFRRITRKFNEIYYQFFEGEGRLGLTDEVNPLEGGLTIEAKYKEDRLKSIDAMSGGEKSLTALAFLFAIQSFDAAPFYIFDEVDAALDKGNSLKLAGMVREISKTTQFISITHNDVIIAEANHLVGVTMNRQKSSVIGLRLRQQDASGEADETGEGGETAA